MQIRVPNSNLIDYLPVYRVRPKKRRKPHLRHPCLDLNKTQTESNHPKNTISTI
jgi:hypothetical protein